jgi:hypothetical protein
MKPMFAPNPIEKPLTYNRIVDMGSHWCLEKAAHYPIIFSFGGPLGTTFNLAQRPDNKYFILHSILYDKKVYTGGLSEIQEIAQSTENCPFCVFGTAGGTMHLPETYIRSVHQKSSIGKSDMEAKKMGIKELLGYDKLDMKSHIISEIIGGSIEDTILRGIGADSHVGHIVTALINYGVGGLGAYFMPRSGFGDTVITNILNPMSQAGMHQLNQIIPSLIKRPSMKGYLRGLAEDPVQWVKSAWKKQFGMGRIATKTQTLGRIHTTSDGSLQQTPKPLPAIIREARKQYIHRSTDV